MTANQPPSEQPNENPQQPAMPQQQVPISPIPPQSAYGYPPPYPINPQYGYPPSGYYTQINQYQQAQAPKAYALRPSNMGREYIPIAPKSGSLIQAWFSILHNLSMANIGGWASTARTSWTVISFAAIGFLSSLSTIALYFIVNNIILPLVPTSFNSTNATTGSTIQLNLQAIMSSEINSIVYLIPFIAIITPLFTSFGLAIFMPQHLGTIRERFVRALKPIALTSVPLYIVSILVFSLIASVTFFIYTRNPITSSSSAPDIANFVLISILVTIPISIFANVYQYMGLIQSGSIGSSLNRWATFGIFLLSSFILGILVDIIIIPIYMNSVFHAIQTIH